MLTSCTCNHTPRAKSMLKKSPLSLSGDNLKGTQDHFLTSPGSRQSTHRPQECAVDGYTFAIPLYCCKCSSCSWLSIRLEVTSSPNARREHESSRMEWKYIASDVRVPFQSLLRYWGGRIHSGGPTAKGSKIREMITMLLRDLGLVLKG